MSGFEVLLFGGSATVYNGGWRDFLAEYPSLNQALHYANEFAVDWQQIVVNKEIWYERFRHVYDPFENRENQEDSIRTLDTIGEAVWVSREAALRYALDPRA